MTPRSKIRKLPGKTAYRLDWRGDIVLDDAGRFASQALAEIMLNAERASKARLYHGHGVDTGTMKKRVHVAESGYNWLGDHVAPVGGGGGELGGKLVMPVRNRQRWGLELGVGQNYAIFYHQKHDRFLLIPFRAAMRKFKSEVEQLWRTYFQ